MKDILRDLVAFQSVTEQFEPNHQALEYIYHYLAERGMHVHMADYNGVESIVATTQHTKTPAVLLNAHVDVSPAPKRLYTLREDDKNFYGRGVYDMKGAIAVYLQLVDDLQDKLHEYDFGIMLTSDEELGGYNGVEPLIKDGYLPTKVCVIPDGGDNWDIEVFAKGLWFVRIIMPGKSAHGSRPWEGENALEKLIGLLHELRRHFPEGAKEARSINIGVLSAGEAVNQIPGQATAEIDIRTTTMQEHQEIMELVKTLCRKHGAEMTLIAEGVPCVNDPEHPHLKAFTQCIGDAIGRPSKHIISYAGTDGRHFSKAGVLCAIVRSPGGGHHSDQEWLAKEGFHQMHTIIGNYIERLGRKQT